MRQVVTTMEFDLPVEKESVTVIVSKQGEKHHLVILSNEKDSLGKSVYYNKMRLHNDINLNGIIASINENNKLAIILPYNQDSGNVENLWRTVEIF